MPTKITLKKFRKAIIEALEARHPNVANAVFEADADAELADAIVALAQKLLTKGK